MQDILQHVQNELTSVVATLKSSSDYLSSIESTILKLTHDKGLLLKQIDQLKGAAIVYEGLLRKIKGEPSKETPDASS